MPARYTDNIERASKLNYRQLAIMQATGRSITSILNKCRMAYLYACISFSWQALALL